ncbi:hypothetical protein ACQY0O_000176 [Thecaphora frezii]
MPLSSTTTLCLPFPFPSLLTWQKNQLNSLLSLPHTIPLFPFLFPLPPPPSSLVLHLPGVRHSRSHQSPRQFPKMPSTEALKASFFLLLVTLGCLCRTYLRNRNGPEAETVVWESHHPASTPEEKSLETSTSATYSDAVSWTASWQADQAAYKPSHGRIANRPLSSGRRGDNASRLQLIEQHLTEKLSASFDETQCRRHATNQTHATAEAGSFDDGAGMVLSAHSTQRRLGMPEFPSLDSLSLSNSGATSPTALQHQFPPAQLRPY